MQDKVITLEAATDIIESGSTLALGGALLQRQPMAFIRALCRRQVKDLSVVTFVCGNGVDLLVGTGQVKAIEAAYIGLGPLGRAPWTTRRAQDGSLRIEDMPESVMMQRFRAAGMGLPCLPTRVLLGTSMPQHSAHVRPLDDPFTGQPMHLVEAARPDITVLHVHAADSSGNTIWPTRRNTDECDLMLAKGARKLIITAERLVTREEVRRNSTLAWIPAHLVAAVVHAPWGAHPGSCDGFYDQDDDHLRQYINACAAPASWEEYLTTYILATDEQTYLERVGGAWRLDQLRSDFIA